MVTSILTTIGVLFSFYKVMNSPKEYFGGLFKAVDNKKKTDSMYFLIVLFTFIAVPAYVFFNLKPNSLDVVAIVVLNIVMFWKLYEILQKPKVYFSGLFLPVKAEKKTSFEPIMMILISIIVDYVCFFNG